MAQAAKGHCHKLCSVLLILVVTIFTLMHHLHQFISHLNIEESPHIIGSNLDLVNGIEWVPSNILAVPNVAAAVV